ncbi:MAG: M20/M25/M40 family metallo-hydrolase [Gemmatimonadaceae bacterium]|nr:M20/M25/M40 family metallo-hydrolase [Gemmatimonadaceae bacterium]
MKRILLAVLGLLGILAAVLVVNTLRVPKPAAAAGQSESLAIDAPAAAARLAGAIRFQTVSVQSGAPIDTAAFLGLHEYLMQTYPAAHAAMRREVQGSLSLLYTWQGADTTAAPIVLMGHLDVVPVTEENRAEWLHAPFGGDVAEGFVWGRGTLDDKSTVVAILEAVESMAAAGLKPARTVYLAFGHDEEVGGRYGARVLVDTLVARGVKPALVIDEGGFLASDVVPGLKGMAAIVGVAEKGYISLKLTSRSAGGHSSMPPTRTSVGALSAALDRLVQQPFPASLDGPTEKMVAAVAPWVPFAPRLALANLWLTEPLVMKALQKSPMGNALTRTTTAPTMLNAGVKDNVLPPEATAVVNFRIRPGETRESVIARVRDIVNDTMIDVSPRDSATTDPSGVSRTDGPAYHLIERTIRAVVPDKPVPVVPYLVMGGTDAKYWSAHSDQVYRFLAAPISASDVPRVHGVNERIGVEAFGTAVEFFARLLRGLDQLSQ